MNHLLEITGLCAGYQPGVNIINNVTMTVDDGERVGIIGLNGSGKSTLGKAIAGMMPHRSGSIRLGGIETIKLSTHQLSNIGVNVMQQGGVVFSNLSVWDNLQLAFGVADRMKNFDRLKTIIPLLQTDKRQLQRCMADRLSGGQRHQLALAMTLACCPKLVILDEPSAGLSPKAIDEMYVIIESVCRETGVAVMLIEQAVSRAIRFCDRSLLIEVGTLAKEFIHPDLSEIEKVMFSLKSK